METSHNLSRVAACAALLCFLAGCSADKSITKTTTTGAIAGCVFDGENLLAGANVFIPDIGPGVRTGAGGKFMITKLAPGRYNVTAAHPSVRRATILGVRVAPDSVTLISLHTWNLGIPEDPPQGQWEESGRKMFSLDDFFTKAMTFTFECEP